MTSNVKSNTLFRTCAESDLPTIQEFANQLYAADPNVPDLRPDISLTFREFARRPDKGRLVVFEKDDRIVGYCIIVFFWSNEYSADLIEVDELFIVEDCRSAGIAQQLFRWLEHDYENIAGFTLQVAFNNEPMMKFTKRAGFSVSRNQHLIRTKVPAKIESM